MKRTGNRLLLAILAMVLGRSANAQEQPPRAAGQSQLSPHHPTMVAARERTEAMAKVEDELRARMDAYDHELRKLREEMRAANGGRPVEGLKEAVASIQRDSTRMRIDLAGMQARKDVIEKAIRSARDEAAKRAAQQDVIAGQLE